MSGNTQGLASLFNPTADTMPLFHQPCEITKNKFEKQEIEMRFYIYMCHQAAKVELSITKRYLTSPFIIRS